MDILLRLLTRAIGRACGQAGPVGWVEENAEHNGQVTARLNC